MIKKLIALRHMSVKEFAVGFRDMKKVIAIIILGLLWCNVGSADELIKIPVHVHILEINEKRYKTKTKPKHVEFHFRKANEIWKQANIFWDVKKIHYVPADTRNFESNIKWMKKNPINKKNKKKINKRRRQIEKQILQVEKHQEEGVINVYYIPYSHSGVCAYVARFTKPLPRKEFLVMGHIMDPSFKPYKFCRIQGIVMAHELGHMLYLGHIVQTAHLMSTLAGETKIPPETVIEVRENYKKYLENYLK